MAAFRAPFDVEFGISLILNGDHDAFVLYFGECAEVSRKLLPGSRPKETLCEDSCPTEHMLNHVCSTGNAEAAGHLALQLIRVTSTTSKCIFNKVMNVCAKKGNMDLVWRWWGALMAVGYRPDRVSFNIFLDACARARNQHQAECCMRALLANRTPPSVVGFSSMIDCFVKVGNIKKAESWLLKALEFGISLDAAIFNVLINAYAKGGAMDKTQDFINLMCSYGVSPDPTTYNCVLYALSHAGKLHQAEFWLGQMELHNLKPDSLTFTYLLKASARGKDADRCSYWFEQMMVAGYTPTLECYNAMVHLYAQLGDLCQAEQWFRAIKVQGMSPTAGTYTCLLGGYSQINDWNGIFQCVEMMAQSRVGIDSVAMRTLLKAPSTHERDALRKRSYDIYCIVLRALAQVGDSESIRKLLIDASVECIPRHAKSAHREFQALFGRAMSEDDLAWLLQLTIMRQKAVILPERLVTEAYQRSQSVGTASGSVESKECLSRHCDEYCMQKLRSRESVGFSTTAPELECDSNSVLSDWQAFEVLYL